MTLMRSNPGAARPDSSSCSLFREDPVWSARDDARREISVQCASQFTDHKYSIDCKFPHSGYASDRLSSLRILDVSLLAASV